ncbi:hypothetical protein CR513_20580, partial [Mucuna pruriens]
MTLGFICVLQDGLHSSSTCNKAGLFGIGQPGTRKRKMKLTLRSNMSNSLTPETLDIMFSMLVVKEEWMRDINDDMENYSSKTRRVMRHMKRLEEKLGKLGGGLGSMRIDTQSVNAKVEVLSKGKFDRKVTHDGYKN